MYKIIFEDGSNFEGGTIHDSKWNDMPTNKIKRLEYYLFAKTIILENYEEYNHIIEYSHIMSINQTFVSKIILMGKCSEEIHSIIIDISKKSVSLQKSLIGQEYNNKPTSGWKVGILDLTPKFYFN